MVPTTTPQQPRDCKENKTYQSNST